MDVDSYLTGSGHEGVLPFTLGSITGGLPGVPTSLSQSQLNVISWLIDRGDKASSDVLKGAFQVAIWNEEYGSPTSTTTTRSTWAGRLGLT